MAKPHEKREVLTYDEIAVSNMWETAALVEVLERKGVLTRKEVLDMVQELRRRTAQAEEISDDPLTTTH